MTAITAPGGLASRVDAPSPLDVVRLQLAKRLAVFGVPLIIIGFVFLGTAIISLAIMRVTGGGGTSAGAVDGARFNQGMVWALSGFMVALGVQGVSTAFPFALALGATRRTFTLGTLLSNVVIAAYVTVVFTALLGLELLTGHWFVDIYLVDVYLLGAGNVAILMPAVFLGTLAMLAVGSLFGSAWIRFGAKGAGGLGLLLGLTLALTLLVLAPAIPDIARAFQTWWLVVIAVAMILGSAIGSVLFLRGASVR